MDVYDKNSLLRHYIRQAVSNSDRPDMTKPTEDIIKDMKKEGTEDFNLFIETFNEALKYIEDESIIKFFNDRMEKKDENTVKFNQFLINNGIIVPNYKEDDVEDDVEDDMEGGRRKRKRKSRRRRKKSMKKSRKRRKSRGRKRKSRRRTRRRRK